VCGKASEGTVLHLLPSQSTCIKQYQYKVLPVTNCDVQLHLYL